MIIESTFLEHLRSVMLFAREIGYAVVVAVVVDLVVAVEIGSLIRFESSSIKWIE